MPNAISEKKYLLNQNHLNNQSLKKTLKQAQRKQIKKKKLLPLQ
jgi:hypothetical protein